MEALQPGDPPQIGGYRLLGRLGAGGMAQVFLGQSPGGRKVAVKLLAHQHAADPQFRERFAREIAAAKLVGGFHTAPVVSADPLASPPWMITAYIPGPSLAATVTQNGPLDAQAVQSLGAALAEGLAGIHAVGLIHRDLKPGNIIMADDGPRIIDLGIARAADATPLTTDGAVIGTFAFMSPEQVRSERTGPESDVFSLGAVLAYAATGHGPFDAATVPAVIHRITSDAPDLQSVHEPLRQIIASCLAKDPFRRPALGYLLAAFSSESLPAYQVSPSAVAPPPPASVPPASLPPASLPPASLPPAFVPPAFVPPAFVPPAAPAWPAIHTLPTTYAAAYSDVPAAAIDVTAVAFSPDGGTLAVADSRGKLQLHDAVTGQVTAVLADGSTGLTVASVVFSPDGQLLIVGWEGRATQVWEVRLRRMARELASPDSEPVSALAVSPDSSVLAVGGELGSICLWQPGTGQLHRTLRRPASAELLSLAFSPGGAALAAGYSDGTACLWTMRDLQIASTMVTRTQTDIWGVGFPDDSVLAAAVGDGSIYVWSAANGRQISLLTRRHASDTAALALAVSPCDPTHLAAGYSFGGAALWDIQRARVARVIGRGELPVLSISYAPDGRRLATGHTEGHARVWDISKTKPIVLIDTSGPGGAGWY